MHLLEEKANHLFWRKSLVVQIEFNGFVFVVPNNHVSYELYLPLYFLLIVFIIQTHESMEVR